MICHNFADNFTPDHEREESTVHVAIEQIDGSVQNVTVEVLSETEVHDAEKTHLESINKKRLSDSQHADAYDIKLESISDRGKDNEVKDHNASPNSINTISSTEFTETGRTTQKPVPFTIITRRSQQERQHWRMKGDRSNQSENLGPPEKRPRGRPALGVIPPPEVNEQGQKVYSCSTCGAEVKTYHALIGKVQNIVFQTCWQLFEAAFLTLYIMYK